MLRYLAFSIILISWRVEVAQIKIYNTVYAKISPIWKAFFTLTLLLSTLGKKDLDLIFFISNCPWLFLK